LKDPNTTLKDIKDLVDKCMNLTQLKEVAEKEKIDITKNLISASIMPNTCKKPVDPKGGNGTIPNGNGTSPNGNGTNPNGTDPNGNKNGTGNCPNKTNCTNGTSINDDVDKLKKIIDDISPEVAKEVNKTLDSITKCISDIDKLKED